MGGGGPSKHEQVELKVDYTPPKTEVDELEEREEQEKAALDKLMQFGDKINKQLLSQHSWQTRICEKLPKELFGTEIPWDSWEKKEYFVEKLPWIAILVISVIYALGMMASFHFRRAAVQGNAFSTPYRIGITWLLVLLDSVLILTLLGSIKALELIMAELKYAETAVPAAIDDFRKAALHLEVEGEAALAKAGHVLRNLFNYLVTAETKINETLTKINDKMNSSFMRCFFPSLVRKWDTADDAAVGKMQKGFKAAFNDEELAELFVKDQQDILSKIMTFQEKSLMPVEKKVALHMISILQKDAWLGGHVIIAFESFLAFWTTFHIFMEFVFG